MNEEVILLRQKMLHELLSVEKLLTALEIDLTAGFNLCSSMT